MRPTDIDWDEVVHWKIPLFGLLLPREIPPDECYNAGSI